MTAGLPLRAGPALLRLWRDGDQAALAGAASHREVWLGLRDRFPYPYTLADAEAWVALNLADPSGDNLAIELDGAVAGGIGMIRRDDVERCSAEVGYWLTPAAWGRGIMTEALRCFTDWVFATRDVERLFALTFASNPGSGRVLEKAGYHLEGVFRQGVIKDGVLQDARLYARLRRDRTEPGSGPADSLILLPDLLAVCRLPADAPWPGWAGGPFSSVTRTAGELSVVCAADAVPPEVQAEGPWRAFRVAGTLSFDLIGILAALSAALAAAGIPCFALSTFDTDYLLVRAGDLVRARAALAGAGYSITD
jgi:RimJ/RimL family protein N-acetyltransferase